MQLDLKDCAIMCWHDKPVSGAWHNGPNPCWVRMIHKPTGVSATAYGNMQHKVRQKAIDALEFLLCDVEEAPRFLENGPQA